jgi:methionine-rich copper-binding protein CopC/putative copper export protein
MKKFLLTFLICISFSLLRTSEVLAHATPITYEPEASAVLHGVPERVRIHFSERIEPRASNIMVFGPDGSRVDRNDAVTDPTDSHFYSVSLKKNGPGIYTVSWQVVSADDGHFTKGAFVFTVGQERSGTLAPPNPFHIAHSSTLLEGITIWVELLGQAILWGGLMVYVLLWRPMRRSLFIKELSNYDGIFEQRFHLLLTTGLCLILAGTVSYLVLKSIDLQQFQTVSFLNAFQTFIFTLTGKFTLYRALLAILFWVIFSGTQKITLKNEKSFQREIFLIILVILMTLARARVSHAAASPFFPNFSIFVNFVHLIFKDIWVGGLIGMVTLVLPILGKIQHVGITTFSLTYFSKLLSLVFGLTGVTGMYIIWLHLKDPFNLLTTDWGIRLVILSIFGLLLFALRFYQQVFIEKAAVDFCTGEKKDQAGKTLSRSGYTLPFETGVGGALLFVTSLLIITTPPWTQKLTFQKRATSWGIQILFTEHPFESDKFLVTLQDERPKTPVPIKDIVITLSQEEERIGPVVPEVEKRFEGGYVFSKNFLSPPGLWKLEIVARRSSL